MFVERVFFWFAGVAVDIGALWGCTATNNSTKYKFADLIEYLYGFFVQIYLDQRISCNIFAEIMIYLVARAFMLPVFQNQFGGGAESESHALKAEMFSVAA